MQLTLRKGTISYEGRKARDAVCDMVSWLGYKRTRLMIRDVVRNRKISYGQYEFYAEFAGVRGKPVAEFYNWFCLKKAS